MLLNHHVLELMISTWESVAFVLGDHSVVWVYPNKNGMEISFYLFS